MKLTKRYQYFTALLLLSLALFVSTTSLAQQRCPLSECQYQRRQNPTRWEGVLSTPLGDNVNLVSFAVNGVTSGRVNQIPIQIPKIGSQAKVSIQAFQERERYLLDKISSNSWTQNSATPQTFVFNWLTNIFVRAGFDTSRLFALAIDQEDIGDVYLPVGLGNPDSSYQFVLATNNYNDEFIVTAFQIKKEGSPNAIYVDDDLTYRPFHSFQWNGRDKSGNQLPDGIYELEYTTQVKLPSGNLSNRNRKYRYFRHIKSFLRK